ncbi:diaminopimelate epimerase [Rubricoccus marinus]|uniref:Diaminopimelate epimerase n=1 Tax=Rubricoccus marinus TaxID=716817 RepID=A0A259U2F8_9BACT|nr:diaminopimelate epimerase [Rubricoccus marinus]OZC04126.1 diaminopimelate epimerase [Rubricoccus marinus]
MIQRQPLIVPFTKMNGAGNDFVVLDNRFLRFSEAELEALARRVCPRWTGVGADGLLALDPPEAASGDGAAEGDASGGTDFRMRYRNADGSLATMCGNGARCLARFAARAGLGRDTPEGTRLAFMTDGGRYTARVTPEADAPASVMLDVPSPRGFGASGATSDLGDVHQIWTGTEHAVVFVEDVDAAPVATEGERLRHDPAFAPAGTNVNFVQRAAASGARGERIRVRTFEKGVEAETLACGTGAMAAALVARLAGGVDADSIAVEMPGGTLGVGFQVVDGEVRGLTLSGPAEFVYEGTLEWWGGEE